MATSKTTKMWKNKLEKSESALQQSKFFKERYFSELQTANANVEYLEKQIERKDSQIESFHRQVDDQIFWMRGFIEKLTTNPELYRAETERDLKKTEQHFTFDRIHELDRRGGDRVGTTNDEVDIEILNNKREVNN